jgi:hypothetical protein
MQLARKRVPAIDHPYQVDVAGSTKGVSTLEADPIVLILPRQLPAEPNA